MCAICFAPHKLIMKMRYELKKKRRRRPSCGTHKWRCDNKSHQAVFNVRKIRFAENLFRTSNDWNCLTSGTKIQLHKPLKLLKPSKPFSVCVCSFSLSRTLLFLNAEHSIANLMGPFYRFNFLTLWMLMFILDRWSLKLLNGPSNGSSMLSKICASHLWIHIFSTHLFFPSIL